MTTIRFRSCRRCGDPTPHGNRPYCSPGPDTYVNPKGRKVCRECRRMRERRVAAAA